MDVNKEIVNDEPAFPVMIEEGLVCEGMGLRDYFAAKAMQGIMANSAFDTIEGMMNASVVAYMMADAMLKTREQQ